MASTRESIERLERVTERVAQVTERVARVTEQSSQENDRRMGQLMETMNRLANIVIVHDERLDDVEHRLDEIEGKSS